MRNPTILFSIVVVFLAVGTNAGAQYIASGGVRVGGTTGFSAKRFFRPSVAVEGIFGTFGNGYSITGLVEKYTPAFETQGLYFFYGAGAHYSVSDGHSVYASHFGREINYDPHNRLGAGIDLIGGIEYKVPKIPLAFSIDMKPFFEVGSGGRTGFAPDPSVGVRYIFQ